ncbi:MAG: hypothetical protein E7378_03150 [Clostridiales bacterium]|nr:hypothetical protein [Clostridiales bacterium]
MKLREGEVLVLKNLYKKGYRFLCKDSDFLTAFVDVPIRHYEQKLGFVWWSKSKQDKNLVMFLQDELFDFIPENHEKPYKITQNGNLVVYRADRDTTKRKEAVCQ